jgi:hypothetical protein
VDWRFDLDEQVHIGRREPVDADDGRLADRFDDARVSLSHVHLSVRLRRLPAALWTIPLDHAAAPRRTIAAGEQMKPIAAAP